MMVFQILISAALVVICTAQIPITNPVTELYGNNSYSWTDNMVNWTCVINVKDYDNDFDKGQDAVLKSCASGGVLFYPSGTYTFTNNLNIKSGVVIRGEPTTDKAKNGKNPGTLNPKTIFECPDLQHNGIYDSNSSSNIGVVNIYLKGCSIMFWPHLSPYSPNYQTYWYDATSVIGAGKNKLILSNKIQDVSLGNPSPGSEWPTVTISKDPWPYRFGHAIAVYIEENALIGNNLLPKSSKSIKTNVVNFTNVPYPYDNRYGIDVNRILYGGVLDKTSGGPCLPTPKNSPYFFASGVVIRGNYVYQNGRVGISWSGGDGQSEQDNEDNVEQGLGAQVYNNHVEIASGTYCYSVTGTKATTGTDTNENRGYDDGGFGNNVTFNTGHINNQCVPPVSEHCKYQTVDGGGILHQCSGNSNGLRNNWVNNDLSGGSRGPMFYYKLYETDNNILMNNIAVQAIGGVFDANHDEHHGNVCKNNNPKCTGIPP